MMTNNNTSMTALVRRRDSVMNYFGINPYDKRERAVFYGRIVGRLAIVAAFVVGAAGYLKSMGLLF